jgi:hypothetical protein
MVPGLLGLAALISVVALSGSAETELRIAVWPRGPEDSGARVWRLHCNPAGGTLPDAAAACRRLLGMQRPFAPVPADSVCTQVSGGPQVARVTGTFRGRRVWATFKRTDGCHISRWNRVRFLFPIAL